MGLLTRRAFLLSIDAALAATILVFGLILLSNITANETDRSSDQSFAQDVLLSFNEMQLVELETQYPWISDLYNETSLIENDSVLYALGMLWVLNDSRSQNLSSLVEDLVPPGTNFRLYAENDELYSTGSGTTQASLSVAYQQITGIDEGQPLAGSSSSAYLKKLRDKRTQKFAYFGGFVGQGNITFPLELPSDVNASSIDTFEMEVDVEADFTLFIDGVQCLGTFSPSGTGDNFTPDYWNLSACNSLLNAGSNNMEIIFPNGVNDAFIGGGYLKVAYYSDAFQESTGLGSTREYLPGIKGIVNLYDSFYVPGTLTGLEIYLHYFANHSIAQNHTFYMTVGNTTVLLDTNSTTTQTITITNSTLASLLNYSLLNKQTVPIRLGFQNLTFETSFEGNADVFLVTDVSGSMDWRMDSNSGGTNRNCDDVNLNASSTQRLSVAKCLDKEFASDILAYSGNEVGLVSYEDTTEAYQTVDLTRNTTLINDTIGTASPETGYIPDGSTCICCGINTATSLLSQGIVFTPIISAGEDWLYTDSYLISEPPIDGSNRTWYDLDYGLEGSWSTGTAILGATNGDSYSPAVVTELSVLSNGSSFYADLWENTGDTSGAPVDFSSGVLNSSANTFGYSGSDDGWDWDPEDNSGPFGYDDAISYPGIVSQELELSSETSGSNSCSSSDCSGAYGISIVINSGMMDMLNANGKAYLSFDYEWQSPYNGFEPQDQVWVKARFSTPSGSQSYLGSSLDSGHSGSDSSNEIATANDPDLDFSDTYLEDIAYLITEGAGTYYLELGGKLRSSHWSEMGDWRFDNIQLHITNDTDSYFFRKHFTIVDVSTIEYVDLSEHVNDTSGAPVDFSSGVLNSSANTFGYSGSDDGWDWDPEDNSGPFGFDDSFVYNDIVSEQLSFTAGTGAANMCSSNDCSGAYGVSVPMTSSMVSAIGSGEYAILSFDYTWTPVASVFEDSDEVWVKARFSTPSGSQSYLGSSLDSGHSNGDGDNDVFAQDNPNTAFSGTFSEDISSLVTEGAGTYYLELGGKLRASTATEYGTWTIDNVQIRVGGIATDLLQKGILNVLSDDRATVYLNGKQVHNDVENQTAEYWNVGGINIPLTDFLVGDNVIAAKIENADGAAKFDLALNAANYGKQQAILVMSDGVANVQCSEQGTGSSTQDAIQAACDASADYGIAVHAVGYSSAADQSTLQSIAACGNGLYNTSSDVTALQDFYANVAFSILEATLQSQTVLVSGSFAPSILYNDSYIDLTYTPTAAEPDPGEIELVLQTEQFNSCSPTVDLPGGVRFVDAFITSYSGEHWTDHVTLNGQTVFDLSVYNDTYEPLGDPYLVHLPANILVSGSNNLTIRTGDAPSNSTGCSPNSSLIYTAYLPSATARTPVLVSAQGCSWSIEYEAGGTNTTVVPSDYTGGNNCSYTNSSISYDSTDAMQVATYQLLNALDFDADGRVLVSLSAEDLEVVITKISSVPYLWGPIKIRAEVQR